MLTQILFLVICQTIIAENSINKLYYDVENATLIRDLFENFMKSHSKNNKGAEKDDRVLIFVENLKEINHLNEKHQATFVSDNYIDENPIMNTYYMVANYRETGKTDRVTIDLFYETFCPYCRKFDTTVLRPIVQDLGPYLDLNLIPYGNAETTYNNGSYYFKCQHGPKECYGNKLHACAINLLNNMTSAVIFNSCLMDYSQPEHGSNDEAADNCGASLSIDPEQIKQCAKSIRGSELLKYYGDLTHKRNIDYVPYILLNGVLNDGDHFREDVCKAFREPPPPCRK